jgi:hypothetical protein
LKSIVQEPNAINADIDVLLDLISPSLQSQCIFYRVDPDFRFDTSGGPPRIVIFLPNGNSICSCLLGRHTGIPCRHYFAVLRKYPKDRLFHLNLINPHWYTYDSVDWKNRPWVRLTSFESIPDQTPPNLPPLPTSPRANGPFQDAGILPPGQLKASSNASKIYSDIQASIHPIIQKSRTSQHIQHVQRTMARLVTELDFVAGHVLDPDSFQKSGPGRKPKKRLRNKAEKTSPQKKRRYGNPK